MTLTVDGELVGLGGDLDSGIECPAVRTEDGRLFAVIGDLGRYQLGQSIKVTGPLALWSTCQTYQVIRADSVALVPAS